MPLIVNLAIIVLFFALGITLRKSPRKRLVCFGIAVFIAAAGYLLPAHPEWIVAALPFGWLIYFTNFYPAATALAFMPSLEVGRGKFHKARIGALVFILFAISLQPFLFFWAAPAETGEPTIDENNICRQTSTDTCAAAAVVTLLSRYGIETSEAEVVRLAYTKRNSGTRTLGQYRAIKILLKEHPRLRVRVSNLSSDELIALDRAAIITVGLSRRLIPREVSEEERKLEEEFQWRPGVMHDVVFLGPLADDPSRVQIGEPDFGLEKWWRYQLDILFTGYAIYLEEVSQPS